MLPASCLHFASSHKRQRNRPFLVSLTCSRILILTKSHDLFQNRLHINQVPDLGELAIYHVI
jgi:hypothetical protein